jgi:hypothetical protein
MDQPAEQMAALQEKLSDDQKQQPAVFLLILTRPGS